MERRRRGTRGGAHWHRRGPVLAGIWAETRWPAAAPWAAVSGDVGLTKTGKTGSYRRGDHHGGVRLVLRRTSVANWSGHGRRRRCQPMFRRRQRCAILFSIQFGWNGVPSTFRRPIRAVPDPRSGSEFPGTGIAATIRVPCDCDCTLLSVAEPGGCRRCSSLPWLPWKPPYKFCGGRRRKEKILRRKKKE